MGATIDRDTGAVVWLPGTICCRFRGSGDVAEPVAFRRRSSLVVLTGLRDEAPAMTGCISTGSPDAASSTSGTCPGCHGTRRDQAPTLTPFQNATRSLTSAAAGLGSG